MAGVHIIYFSTPFLSPFILTFPSLSDFTPLILRLLLEPVNVLFQSFMLFFRILFYLCHKQDLDLAVDQEWSIREGLIPGQ